MNIIDKEELAQIFCHIFGITKAKALQAIDNASDWSVENTESPMWANWFASNAEFEIYKLNTGQDMISSIFWRTILYLYVGSARGYNYYPDSIRIPIVAYVLNALQSKLEKYKLILHPVGQELISGLEEEHSKVRENLVKRRSANNWIEIDIPAVLTYVFSECDSKDDFIKNALKLRDSKNIKNIRQFIADIEGAVKSDNLDKYMKLMDLSEEVSKDRAEVQNVPFYIQALPSVSLSPGPAGISMPSDTMGKRLYKYFKTRRLAFFSDVSSSIKQISFINSQINKLFGSDIHDDHLGRFRELRAYQDGYLSAVSTGEINI